MNYTFPKMENGREKFQQKPKHLEILIKGLNTGWRIQKMKDIGLEGMGMASRKEFEVN